MTPPPIDPPDTDLARRARRLLHAACDPHVAAHCERSFQFAALLARADDLDVDVEVLFIGTVLHDVGLAARFRGPERFEMRGANAVRAVLDSWPRHDFPPRFSQTIVDEVRANPSAARSSWMEGIAEAHVPGFRPADFLATLHASDHFV